jgi:ethanolamine utilization protein EutA (predicted chaperonin)
MNWLTIHFRQQLDSEIERLNAEIKQLKVEVIDLKAKNADQETLIQRILYAQSVTNNNHQSSG